MSLRPALYVIALLALVVPAQAQYACGNRAEIIKAINAKYKELPSAWGISGNHSFVELYLNEETGSWTILSTQATGLTCVTATGVDWQEMPPVIKGKPS